MRMMLSSFLQKKRAATWSLTLCQGGLRHPPPAAGQPSLCSGPLLATKGDSQTEKHRPTRRGHQHHGPRQGPRTSFARHPSPPGCCPPSQQGSPPGRGAQGAPRAGAAPHLRQKTEEQPGAEPGPPRRHPGPAAPPPALFPSGAGPDPFRTG